MKRFSGSHPILAGLIATAAPVSASAAEVWYVTGEVGAVFLEDSSDTARDTHGDTVAFNQGFDPGFDIHGAVGYLWHGLRLEGEILYRENDADRLRATSITPSGLGRYTTTLGLNANGDASALAFMANAWYDVDIGRRWHPFFGGGVGVARILLDNVRATIADTAEPLADDADMVLAYQAGAGIGFDLGENMVLGLDYRFFATKEPEFATVGSSHFNVEYHSHNVELSLRIAF